MLTQRFLKNYLRQLMFDAIYFMLLHELEHAIISLFKLRSKRV